MGRQGFTHGGAWQETERVNNFLRKACGVAPAQLLE